MISRTKEMIPLPSSFTPGPGDVICSKGKEAKKHPANLWLRELIKDSLPEYSACPSKIERSFVVSRIMTTIRDASPGGGFIRQMEGSWFEVGDRNAREKIGQAFRDLLHDRYRSSTKAKASIRRKRAAVDTTSVPSSDSTACSKEQSPALEPCAPTSGNFPIGDIVSFFSQPMLPQQAEFEPELTLKDLEPLPLSQGLKFDLSSSSIDSDSDSSFEKAMQGLYQSQFQISSNKRRKQKQIESFMPPQYPQDIKPFELLHNARTPLHCGSDNLRNFLNISLNRVPSN